MQIEKRIADEINIPVIIKDSANAKKIIMPGQGSFDYAMENIHKLNIYETIRSVALDKKTPILGICLGMQLLATSGTENKFCKGLNLIEGTVKKLNCPRHHKRCWKIFYFHFPTHLKIWMKRNLQT